ncbi:MAG: hypothetical protein K2Q09_03495 [Phycisphaerales bacterium]|nr:hypothetical protein [Phycisphaerales bacterium]
MALKHYPLAAERPVLLPISTAAEQVSVRGAAARWGGRAGVAVFCFFLIKGLAWLIVPGAIAYFAGR